MGIENIGSRQIGSSQGGYSGPSSLPLSLYILQILFILSGLEESILNLLAGLTLLIAGMIVLFRIAQTGDDTLDIPTLIVRI